MEINWENKVNADISKLDSLFIQLNQILKLDLEVLSVHLFDDEGLLEINRKFLDHDYYTDIITFDLRDEFSNEAELFISTERINDNAISNGLNPEEELFRICIHSMLHLAGFNDKTESDIKTIRQKENEYLQLLFHVKHL